jgi:PKD repeat protein
MKTTTLILATVAAILPAFSQTCPDCVIDESYTLPGLYPVSIPPATAGEYYETDLTFVLQEDTTVDVLGDMVTFEFLNYNILEPIGLPYGIHVSSNLGDFPVNYDPDVSLYGCAKVCGTPLIAGTYTITVPLIATLEDPAGDQPAEYEIILEVLPASGSSGGIVSTATFGCSPLTVDLSSGHPSGGADGFSYTWNFGDGTSGTMEDPSVMTFTADGTEPVEYIITHTVAVDTIGYSLDYVVVTATNCDDCTIFGCTGLFLEENPDLYLSIPDLGITTDYYLDTNPPLTFSLNAAIDPFASYSMQVKDDDDGGFGADDNCGSIEFNGNDVGLFSYDIGSSNVDISISHPIITYSYTDTIIVYPVPEIPVLTVVGETVICEEDSVVLSTTAAPASRISGTMAAIPFPALLPPPM